MYIKDGIAYAGEPHRPVVVCGVRPMADYRLWVRFTSGETRTVDFAPLLDRPAFAPLRDPAVWHAVGIDYGCPVWLDGDIDIAPEYLLTHGQREL